MRNLYSAIMPLVGYRGAEDDCKVYPTKSDHYESRNSIYET